MTAKLTPAKRKEFQQLHDRATATLQFVESLESSEARGMIRARLAELLASGDLRGMRRAARDVDQATVGLSQDQRDGLDAVLQKQLGVDRAAELAARRLHVERTLHR